MTTMVLEMPQPTVGSLAKRGLRRFLRTPKGWLTAFFLPLLAVAGTSVGWGQALPHVLAAVGGACVVDLLATRALTGRWSWPSSAMLSGLIIAFVLGPEQEWALTLGIGGLASALKHIIRTERGHIFNPAALALVSASALFGTSQSWWGALPGVAWPWLLLLMVGAALLVDRIDRFPLVLSFLGTYLGLFLLVSFVDATAAAEMFRTPFIQAALFFACFMLTDPPTAPSRPIEQIVIGPLVAGISCAARLLGAGQVYLLVGLLAGNAVLVQWRAVRARRQRLPASGF